MERVATYDETVVVHVEDDVLTHHGKSDERDVGSATNRTLGWYCVRVTIRSNLQTSQIFHDTSQCKHSLRYSLRRRE